MCGITGVFGIDEAGKLASEALEIIGYRGKDGHGIEVLPEGAMAHNLHSIVSKVKQPLKGKGVFVSNCEIYNWKELAERYNVKARNDSELVFMLFEKGILPERIDELDGDYAVAYCRDEKVFVARDNIGVKPVWFSAKNISKKKGVCFGFASEKKALEAIGFMDAEELNPRKMIEYDVGSSRIKEIKRKFFTISPEHKDDYSSIKRRTEELLRESVKKRVPKKKVGLLFSGGIDSTFLAMVLKELGVDFTCYTAAIEPENDSKEAEDAIYAKKAAERLGLKLKMIRIKREEVEGYLKIAIPLIEDSNVVKVGVALPFYVCCEQAKKDGVKVMLSGLGSEEIFAGYERHKHSSNVNKECYSGLLKMYERDLYRDDVVTMANSIELRVPFLDKELVDYALKIPSEYKLDEHQNKIILRDIATGKGMPDEFAQRKKRAAQYGSRFDRALEKLAKKKGFRKKSDYLDTFYRRPNLRLGVLFSSGKDSAYAAYVIRKQNYEISCLITLRSRNPSSYMFHTPAVDLAKMQAEAMGIPLVEQATEGEKEKELKDLEKAIVRAKKEYRIDGIITGALFSDYQRSRIERICDKLGLKVFSPLWHKDQSEYMHELIKNRFRFIITSVAAEGLDKTWIGRTITEKDVNKLDELSKKIGINAAGEGGEFETLVIDSPMFRKAIIIKEFDIKEESENTAMIDIKNAVLEEK